MLNLPSVNDFVWPWKGVPFALLVEQQGGAALDSPVKRSGPCLCTAGSPQVQCPGPAYKNTNR